MVNYSESYDFPTCMCERENAKSKFSQDNQPQGN